MTIVDGVDAVVTWVDGSDEQWRMRKQEALGRMGSSDPEATSASRYRDWGTLRYWFRGIESFAPWFRSVIFVTEGHVPEWLNLSAPNLRVVRHEDFMPAEYLPTFSSRAIELNLHRIEDLSDRFVYFNDDMFVISPTPMRHFFKDGLPAGVGVAKALHNGGITDHASLNAAHVLNRHFDKKHVMMRNPGKWFSPKYGTNILRTLALLPWRGFTGFRQTHLPQAILKSTMEELWQVEYEWLDRTSRQTFREHSGLNPYVIDYWQLAKGEFFPVSPSRYGGYRQLGVDRIEDIVNDIRGQRYRVLCVNDGLTSNFEADCEAQLEAFRSILPTPSVFEKRESTR